MRPMAGPPCLSTTSSTPVSTKRAGSRRSVAALASAPPSGSTRGRRRSAPTSWSARCRKLALGLESIERQGGAIRPQEPHRSAAAGRRAGSRRGRDFVTYSLDRLEARLEALSKRLEQRAGSRFARRDGSGEAEQHDCVR